MDFFNNFFKKNYLSKLLILTIITFSITLYLYGVPIFKELGEIVYNITCSYPINNSFFNEEILMTFVGDKLNLKVDTPQIKIPFEDYKVINNILEFDIEENTLLRCGADGVVKNVGYKDNYKYIEILHSGNIKAVYKNVDVIGVNSNLEVSKGQLLATVEKGQKLQLYFTYNDEILSDFKIKEGEIIWEK